LVRPNGGRRHSFEGILVLLTLCICACDAQPPAVDPIPTGQADAGGSGYVDLIVSYDEAGTTVTCTEAVGSICSVQTGPCAGHPVLGAPDGSTFDLSSGSQIELGFLCQPIVDRAPNSDLSPDFRVVATFAGVGNAIVSVSEDGSNYTVLDTFTRDNQEFDLATESLEFVKFVRIANSGSATLSIDAIEVL
jgi:hypothetical protein